MMRRRSTRIVRSSDVVVVYSVLIGMFVVAAFTTPQFATEFNLQSALAASVPLGLVAIGQTFVVLTGGIDLSVGSMMGLTSIVGAMYMNGHDERIASGVLLCVAIGAGLGLFNGLIITVLRLQPIVATLGTLSIIQGLALMRNKTPGGFTPPELQNLSYENFLRVPKSFYVLLSALALGFFVLRRTRYGLQLYALGGSEHAARLSGVHTTRLTISVYVVSGMFAAFAGVMLSARLGLGDPVAGQVFLLTSVAAVAIGGTSLFGGRGGLAGTFAGVMILTLLNNILTLRDVGTYPQQVITGLLIIVVVALYSNRLRIRPRRASEDGTPAPTAERQ
jgi:ribose transport system permease protein